MVGMTVAVAVAIEEASKSFQIIFQDSRCAREPFSKKYFFETIDIPPIS